MSDLAITLVIAIAAPITVSLVAGYFSVRQYAQQARVDIRRELESQLNEQRRDLYFDFRKTMTDILTQATAGKPQYKLNKAMMDLATRLLLVGSDEVMAKFLQWRETGQQTNPEGVLIGFASMFIEMRKDIGYSTTDLTERDVLKSFLTDLDNQPKLLQLLDELEREEAG